MATFKIEGVEELDIKLSRFYNFLGKDYNKAMRKIGRFGVKRFKQHILKGYAIGNFSVYGPIRTPDTVLSLQEDYAEMKKEKWGFIYPILIASKKMYNDIKYFTGIAIGAGKSKKYILKWGFKTKRSQLIAKAHLDGIKRTKNPTPVVRIPFFLTIAERGHITRILRETTKNALRKARLKRI